MTFLSFNGVQAVLLGGGNDSVVSYGPSGFGHKRGSLLTAWGFLSPGHPEEISSPLPSWASRENLRENLATAIPFGQVFTKVFTQVFTFLE